MIGTAGNTGVSVIEQPFSDSLRQHDLQNDSIWRSMCMERARRYYSTRSATRSGIAGSFQRALLFSFFIFVVCIALAALGGASEFYDGWHGCVQRIATGQRHGLQRAARHQGDATQNAWLSDSDSLYKSCASVSSRGIPWSFLAFTLLC